MSIDSIGVDLNFHNASDLIPPLQDVWQAVVRVYLPFWGSGTGFFISGDGYFLTVNHNAGEDICSTTCNAMLLDVDLEHRAKRYSLTGAQLIFADASLDIALFKVEPINRPFPWVNLGPRDRKPPQKGDTLYVIGHPRGYLKKWSRVETLDYKELSDYELSVYVGGEGFGFRGSDIIMDQAIYTGSSGSPVVAKDGVLEGVQRASNYSMSAAIDRRRLLDKYPFLWKLNAEEAPAFEELDVDLPNFMTPPSIESIMASLEGYQRGESPTSTLEDLSEYIFMIANGPPSEESLDVLFSLYDKSRDRSVYEIETLFKRTRAISSLTYTFIRNGKSFPEDKVIKRIVEFVEAAQNEPPGEEGLLYVYAGLRMLRDITLALGRHEEYRELIHETLLEVAEEYSWSDLDRALLFFTMGASPDPATWVKTIKSADVDTLRRKFEGFDWLSALQIYPNERGFVRDIALEVLKASLQLQWETTTVLRAQRIIDEIDEDRIFDGF